MKLLAIDGNSLINRAFYGIRLLTNKKGQYTNAIYGFLNMYFALLKEYEPQGVLVAFDLKAPTFRHKIFENYKAGRHAMPDELRQQFPILKQLLQFMGCHIVEKEGYEADDIIGTISAAATEGDFCYIATGDRDSFQLIKNNTNVILATSKGNVVYDEARIKDEYGVTPEKMIEIKALQGDSSDNIPGVAGIGPKTARKLVEQYGSIDVIFNKIDELEVSAGIKNKLKAGRDSAYMSRELGTICLDVDIETKYGEYSFEKSVKNEEKLSQLLTELEMFKILERMGFEKSENKSLQESEQVTLSPVLSGVKDLTEKLCGTKQSFVNFVFEKDKIKQAYFLFDKDVYFINDRQDDFSEFIKIFLCDESIGKITYDSKTIYKYALKNGFECKGIKDDITLGAYVVDPSLKSYEPSALAKKFGINNAVCESKEALYTYYMPQIYEQIFSRLKEDNQESLYRNVELPVSQVLASMEHEGFMTDKKAIENYSVYLQTTVNTLKQEICSLCGFEFNINSPKQLGEALFEKLSLRCPKKTKTGYSTNVDVLEELRYDHPVIEKILQYRTFSKLKSTYCDGLLKEIDEDGKIRSTFNQTETRTGRLSSTEPNLQNIPVRTPEGREFRKFFIAGEGNVLVDADYSQIELRVLASMADDKNMIEAFNENKDFHTTTAAKVFNMPENMVTPLMRSRAKAVNFGIVYGIGAFSLAKDIGVTRKEAEKYINDYLSLYSGVRAYMKSTIENAKTLGYAQTMMGRRRYLPELNDSSAMVRKFGERVAMNMPIQGTAADIIKIAMIRVFNRLKEEKMSSKLIMQVHDELIVEAPEDEAEKAKLILKEEMENAFKMKVKLVADANIGKTWYLAKG